MRKESDFLFILRNIVIILFFFSYGQGAGLTINLTINSQMNYFSLDVFVTALREAACLLKCCLQPAYSTARCNYVQVKILLAGSPSPCQLKGQKPLPGIGGKKEH